MRLNVPEAMAMADLLRWLADKPHGIRERVTDREAIEAMEQLGRGAGKVLQVAPDQSFPVLIIERLRAADSDGAAQAVCRALEQQTTVPWGVQGPLEAWRAIRDAAAADVDQVHAEQSSEVGW